MSPNFALLCLLVAGSALPASEPVPVRVMTFNVWVGGEAGGQPIEQTAAVIRAGRADIVGIQESRGGEVNGVRPDITKRLAAILGWHSLEQGDGRAILSRFRIVGPTGGDRGALVELPGGQLLQVFNLHLYYAPYQPYQLLRIPYENGAFISTGDEAVREARAARGKEVDSVLEALRPALWTGLPLVLTGDFNEPSCLDWTEAAVLAKRCPVRVDWPATRRLAEAGLIDSLRALRPDPVAHPALTWTPTTREDDPRDRHDRIDFVFHAGAGVRPLEAALVGERKERAEIVVEPYPSDHRAVVVAFEIGGEPKVSRGYSIPTVDFAPRLDRQVIVDREPGQYLGHPTTVLLEDGRTMLCVYPKGHGRGAIVLKRSLDGGLTWSDRLPTPASWATSLETPTIHRTVSPDGRRRLVLFSGLYPIRRAVSDDNGATWSELEPVGDFGGIVAMASVVPIDATPGRYLAFFHDDGRFLRKDAPQGNAPAFVVYKILSVDGGMTWSAPEAIARPPSAHLCEPGAIRSPDGKTLALLLRENSRRSNSFMILSRDEGKTWSPPRELPAALTGDRHVGRHAPDGRLLITFRDTTLESPTRGDWVAWVGTFDDLILGREGQLRARLLGNHKAADCAYPGLELLPDGTFVATTYGHWTPGEQPYVVSVRFRVEELEKAPRL